MGEWPGLSLKHRNAWAFLEIARACSLGVCLSEPVKILFGMKSSSEKNKTEVTSLTQSLSLDHSKKGQM